MSFPVHDLSHWRHFGNLTVAADKTGCSDVYLPRFFSLSISQGFQRPIFFDRKTEEERKSYLAKLAKSVEEQTKIMTKLITLLESKQSPDSAANDTAIGLKE